MERREGDAQRVILLDTHALIWLAGEPNRLSRAARETIRQSMNEGGLAISAITLWELAWLATHGRLSFLGTAEGFIRKISSRTAIVPISIEVAVLASQLPDDYPGDPCDRLIGATALVEKMVLITKDRNIRNYKQIKTIW